MPANTSFEEVTMRSHVRSLARSFRVSRAFPALLAMAAGCSSASEQAGSLPSPRRAFEPASLAVPAGSVCSVHPEGDTDPTHAIRLRADADGIARFHALPP